MTIKNEILKNNFIYYKEITQEGYKEITVDDSKFFYDSESCPVLPNDIVEQYNLTQVDYSTLPNFETIIDELRKTKQLHAQVYIWQLGNSNTNKVYWGNTIQELIEFIESIDTYKVQNKINISTYDVYVHNLSWDIEFIKYWLKDKQYQQIVAGHNMIERKKTTTIANAFEIVEHDSIVYNARLQLDQRKVGRRKVMTSILFIDSMKITPLSLSKIGTDLIDIEDIYKKNSTIYNYNIVRDSKTYKPTEVESWYCYCDIYILKEWYNQFIVPNYINQGIKPYTISQIAFDSIVGISLREDKANGKYDHLMDKKGRITDRAIYEEHYALKILENNPAYTEYIRESYRGGITTTGKKYREIAKDNQSTIGGVSIDITSSYPDKCVNYPLPYGAPTAIKQGKYEDLEVFDKVYNFHYITIGFDGWHSINPQNQFGLPIKVYGLNDKEKSMLQWTPNEIYTTNCVNLTYVGTNRPDIKDKKRRTYIDSLPYKYIVTLTHFEYELWEKMFRFIRYEDGKRVKGVKFIDFISFQSEVGFMAKGIQHYYNLKEEGTIENNTAKTYNSKIIINSFYGKNCSKRERSQRFYDFNNDVIKFEPVTEENKNEWLDNKLYAIQYGAAVTSWGRVQLMETAYKLGCENFVYADTDSLKIANINKTELIDVCNIEGVKLSTTKETKVLGSWDYEYTFIDIKAIAQKKYMYQPIEDTTGEVLPYVVKCSGLPQDIRDTIKTKDQFNLGSKFVKNAKQKVAGGYLLLPTEFTITDNTIY